jgi:hypothetical protein
MKKSFSVASRAALAGMLVAGASCGNNLSLSPPPHPDVPTPTDRSIEPAPAAQTEPLASASLYRDPGSIDFSSNPDLVARLIESPHRYFRFINSNFSRAVCARFRDELASMPSVALHGDAHLEQYAVTDLGRGLTDFDDSSRGPAAIDLVRFETSIRLAVRQVGWEAEEEALIQKFLDGYRAALADPNLEVAAPAVVDRYKSEFSPDRTSFLKYAESVMDPFESNPQVDKAKFFATVSHYVDHMQKVRNDLPGRFFTLKRAGVLRVGVGSALDKKFLLRMDGPTESPEDDIILEAKEVKALSDVPCVTKHLPNRSLELRDVTTGTYQPEFDLGYVFLPGADFWVHEWSANYKEIKISKSFKSSRELAELVYDVGVQLGRGHALGPVALDDEETPPDVDAEPAARALELGRQRGKLQLVALQRHEREIAKASKDLARETKVAWERFKRVVEDGSASKVKTASFTSE